jgi:ArsR family transcriptional regulator
MCHIQFVNDKGVEEAIQAAPDAETISGLVETFKTLADPTRLRIISALRARELCVCDLAAILKLTQSAVSHQLRVLRNQRIVRYRRDGKISYYSLDDKKLESVLDLATQHQTE